MRSLTPLAVLVIALGAGTASARPNYPSLLPNGTAIDGRGCINCHTSAQGGGSRNAFGSAMSNAGLDWSSVCHSDSDGDGQTNGQELGDPDCIWTSGAAARSTAISNPGKASSTSTNPTGGASGGGTGTGGEGEGEGEGATQPTCPAHSSPSGTGCACDAGFQPNAAGTACVAVSTGGGTGGGTGGTGGTPQWMCDPTWQGDGDCDCGCGAPDPDCAGNSIDTCHFNDCDTWQTTQGLDPDSTDPTLCAGGDPPTITGGTTGGGTGGEGEGEGAGGGTVTPGGCPANSSPSADNTSCSCNAGYHPDSSHSICLQTQTGGGGGEGEAGGGGEGEGEGAAVTCGANQVASGAGCVCESGFVLDDSGACVVLEAREGEGEGEGDGTPHPTTGCDSTGPSSTGPVAALALACLAISPRRRRRRA